MRCKSWAIGSFISILGFIIMVHTDLRSADKKAIQEKLPEIEKLLSSVSHPKYPGFIVGLFFDGEPLFKKCYGQANMELNVPISESTLFNIGSTAKQFTAMAVVLLAQQKKLSLDDDIRTYIPEMPDFKEAIIIRHLIYHTSGMRDWIEGFLLGGHKAEDSFTHEEIIKKFILSQRALNFDPGDEFLYCNSGYSLLAEIISRVSGMTFRRWMEDNILSPLNMKNTYVADDHHMILPNRADAYNISNKGEVSRAILNGSILGAGGMYTTLDDLAKWAFNFEEAKLGGVDTIRQMNEAGKLNDGTSLDYAFGQYIYDLNGLRLYSHGGQGAGWQAGLIRCPEQKFVFIILANNSKLNMNIVFPILNILFQDQFKRKAGAPKREQFAYQEAGISPLILEEYAGRYWESSTVAYTVCHLGDHLTIRRSGQPPVAYFPASAKDFLDKKGEANNKVSFNRDESGNVISITLENTEEERCRTAKKIRSLVTVRKSDNVRGEVNLNEFCGEYVNDELGAMYSLAVSGDKLVAKHHWGEEIVMIHECFDFFCGDRFWARDIEFIRDEGGKVTGFNLTGSRIANVRFDKITVQ